MDVLQINNMYLFLGIVCNTWIDLNSSEKCRISIKKLFILRNVYLKLRFKLFTEFEITSPCSQNKPTDHSPNQHDLARNFVISLSEASFNVLVPHSFLINYFFPLKNRFLNINTRREQICLQVMHSSL